MNHLHLVVWRLFWITILVVSMVVIAFVSTLIKEYRHKPIKTNNTRTVVYTLKEQHAEFVNKENLQSWLVANQNKTVITMTPVNSEILIIYK
jgi:hypothetical protein